MQCYENDFNEKNEIYYFDHSRYTVNFKSAVNNNIVPTDRFFRHVMIVYIFQRKRRLIIVHLQFNMNKFS